MRSKHQFRSILLGDAVLLVAALGGARIYALFELGRMPSSFGEILTPALRFPGGMLGLAVGGGVIWWMKGRSFAAAMFDVVAPGMGFALGIVGVGCFLNGCCTGYVSELPWALRFPSPSPAWRTQVSLGIVSSQDPWSLAVHPLQLYMSFMSMILGVGLYVFASRKVFDGQLFLTFIAFHGIAKGMLESLRFPYHGHLQAMSFLGALVAGGLLIWLLSEVRGARRDPFTMWSS
jgi:phosphatidylglycerol:prolipoprotein diacylglycerol transferase